MVIVYRREDKKEEKRFVYMDESAPAARPRVIIELEEIPEEPVEQEQQVLKRQFFYEDVELPWWKKLTIEFTTRVIDIYGAGEEGVIKFLHSLKR